MRPLKRRIRALGAGIALLGAMGCGQKGPLYLPDHNGAVVTRPAGEAQSAPTPSQEPGNSGTNDNKKKRKDEQQDTGAK